MKAHLLDANVLISLAWPNHPSHSRAHAWFGLEQKNGWGTCICTQLAFIRISSNPVVPYHVSPQAAHQQLLRIVALSGHRFLSEPAEGFSNSAFTATMPSTLTHHLVTDAYLVTLATIHKLRLATFDQQLVRIFPDAVLV